MASSAFRFNSAAFAYEAFDDEIVILNLASGTYYALGGCIVDCWDDLADARSVAAIEAAVAERYGLSAHEVAADLGSAVAKLVEEKILEVAEPSSDGVALTAPDSSRAYASPTFEKHSDMQDLLTLDPIHDVDPQKGWPHY